MANLHCSGCGVRVPIAFDARLGLLPTGILCPGCSSPAYGRFHA